MIQENLRWLMYLWLIDEHNKIRNQNAFTRTSPQHCDSLYFLGNKTADDVSQLFSLTTCCYTSLVQQQISVKEYDVTNQLSVQQPKQNVQ